MKTIELTGSSVSKEPSHSMKVSLVSVTLRSWNWLLKLRKAKGKGLTASGCDTTLYLLHGSSALDYSRILPSWAGLAQGIEALRTTVQGFRGHTQP